MRREAGVSPTHEGRSRCPSSNSNADTDAFPLSPVDTSAIRTTTLFLFIVVAAAFEEEE